MNLYPKYVTVDDFKNFTGIDLAAVLRTDDNESNQAERFLLQTEEHLMTWIDRNTFRVLDYDHLNPAQLENFKKAILSQALYTYRNGAIALGLESGYDSERGIVTDPDKLAQLEVCQSAINYLTTAGLYNLNVKNRPRVMRGYPGLEGISFDGGGVPAPNPDLIGFDPNDYVTLDTDQNITGQKYFAKDILLGDNVGIKNGANYLIYYDATNDATSFSKTIIPGEDATYNLGKSNRRWNKLFVADKINQNANGFGLLMPDTAGYNANKTLATTDELGNATKIRGVDLPENPDTPITPRVLTYNPDNTISWDAGGGGGMYNPMTTPGDMIVGSTNGEPVRLAKGTAGQVLVSGSSAPEWQTLNTDYTGGTGITINASTREISADTSVLETKTNAANTYATKLSVESIEALIPAQASSSNKLADKDFVNSSIATNTANFLGTYNIVTDLGLTVDASHSDVASAIATKLASLSITPTNNDYVFVAYPDAVQAGQFTQFDRYKYNGSAWEWEYTLNNSSFTAQQWAAINSGITATILATLARENIIAPAYDNTATYSVGDKCVYNGKLYTCNTAIAVAEDFNSSKWTEISVSSGFVDLTSAQTIIGQKTFNSVIKQINGIQVNPDADLDIKNRSGQAIFRFTESMLRPMQDNSKDLGTSQLRFKDLCLAGKLRDGNNATYGLILPDSTNWTVNKEIATTDQVNVKANESVISDQYDSTKTYAVGDIVIYNNVLYKCTTAITQAEAWDSSHWTATTVAELVSDETIALSNTIGFPKIATPSSITLNNDEKANIIKGCIIENFNIGGTQWQKCIFYPSGDLFSNYYMGMLVAQRNGYYRLYQYAINDTNNLLTIYGNKYIDIDSGSNITINGLNKINSTNVSDIEALILYAKTQGWIS